MSKKYKNIDLLADIEKDPDFKKYYKDASFRTRLAIGVYNMRKRQNLSQQELAKRAGTTQKIISEIERGDYKVGSCLQNRIMKELKFNLIDLGGIYNYCKMPIFMPKTKSETKSNKPVDNIGLVDYKTKEGQKTSILNF